MFISFRGLQLMARPMTSRLNVIRELAGETTQSTRKTEVSGEASAAGREAKRGFGASSGRCINYVGSVLCISFGAVHRLQIRTAVVT